MKRHFSVHNKQYRHRSDIYMLIAMSCAVTGVLTFLTVIIPVGELGTGIAISIAP